jgi:hypothetical protein
MSAAAKLALWREKPQVMVRQLFGVTPDPWQEEVLEAFPHKPRQAMKASKGPGKTATLSWLGWNFLLTRAHCNIAATSISSDNLRDGLWKEMSYWRGKSPLLQDQFEITSERIFQKQNKNTWFMTARNWAKSASPEDLGATLAGLHADHIMFLIDEAGAMPVAISATAEAALSSARDGHIVMAGNTNSLEGALYDACVKRAAMWHVTVISGDPDDPKRSPRVSLEWAQEMVRSYGRDSPFVKVSVLGEWPAASVNALISANDVEAAMKRVYRAEDIARAPRLLGVDVARNGLAKSVLFPRQGMVAFRPHRMVNATSLQGAAQVSRIWRDWELDACFVDSTGGFGAGWIDQLHVLNRTPTGVGFAEAANDPARYFNRRAEMYFSLTDWIKAGGALPSEVPELISVLPAITYTFKGDRLLLEPKELVEAKIGIGTGLDESDALALTFAAPVAPRNLDPQVPRRHDGGEYDPFARYFARA